MKTSFSASPLFSSCSFTLHSEGWKENFPFFSSQQSHFIVIITSTLRWVRFSLSLSIFSFSLVRCWKFSFFLYFRKWQVTENFPSHENVHMKLFFDPYLWILIITQLISNECHLFLLSTTFFFLRHYLSHSRVWVWGESILRYNSN